MKAPIYLILILSFLGQSFGEDVRYLSDEELDKLISKAAPDVQYRNNGKAYLPRKQTPYTGWTAQFYKNGGIKWMTRFEDGEMKQVNNWDQDGSSKGGDSKFPQYDVWSTSGKLVGAIGISTKYKYKSVIPYKPGTRVWHGLYKRFYFSGEKHLEREFEDGKPHGFETRWYENGQKKLRALNEDGKLMSLVVWKPNGEKCPHTNLNDGKGVGVWYNEDGTVYNRKTYNYAHRVED
jgi:antitoxin component YwqK of YwqJK toxin-antitoxin module